MDAIGTWLSVAMPADLGWCLQAHAQWQVILHPLRFLAIPAKKNCDRQTLKNTAANDSRQKSAEICQQFLVCAM